MRDLNHGEAFVRIFYECGRVSVEPQIGQHRLRLDDEVVDVEATVIDIDTQILKSSVNGNLVRYGRPLLPSASVGYTDIVQELRPRIDVQSEVASTGVPGHPIGDSVFHTLW